MRLVGLLLRSLRPRQWTKNLIVFVPAVFAGVLLEVGTLPRVAGLFIALCTASGAVYLMNDVADRQADHMYDRTRSRPVAAGTLAPSTAAVASLALGMVGVGAAYALSTAAGHAVLGYVALQMAYTFLLKSFVLIDVFAIVGGFVLRAVAGAAVLNIENSKWLLACAGLLVLFLALVKRRQELVELGAEAPRHRATLAGYSLPMLDVMVASATAATIIGYLLYTLVGPGSVHPGMVFTVPFVLYGLLRYLVILYSGTRSETAEEILLGDWPMSLTVIGWLLTVLIVVYT